MAQQCIKITISPQEHKERKALKQLVKSGRATPAQAGRFSELRRRNKARKVQEENGGGDDADGGGIGKGVAALAVGGAVLGAAALGAGLALLVGGGGDKSDEQESGASSSSSFSSTSSSFSPSSSAASLSPEEAAEARRKLRERNQKRGAEAKSNPLTSAVKDRGEKLEQASEKTERMVRASRDFDAMCRELNSEC